MKKALVVDDCTETSAHIGRLLEKNGFEVIEARDGEEAIDKANEFSPDVVLMDIVMPGVNGFQATRQLNRSPNTSEIPVIMVSAKNQEVDKRWSEKQGAKAYICKPVSENDLMKTIRQVAV